MSETPNDFSDLFKVLGEKAVQTPDDEKNLHPQTMCPAFGGLRVLTRINGAQVCLATDKGCMYGLTFVSHFYAARRSIVSPEVMNHQLANGTLIQDLRNTIDVIAADPTIRLIPVVTLCVSETAGVAEELLPKRVGNADVVVVRLPAYLIKSHPEAKDIALEALLKRYAANRDRTTPTPTGSKKRVVIIGEIFPLDALKIGNVLEQMGVGEVVTLPSMHLDDFREAADVDAAAILHPFYELTDHFFKENGVPVVSGNPVGANSTFKWITDLGHALGLDHETVEAVAIQERDKIKSVFDKHEVKGTVLIAGYEGNEFPLVRLLLEAGVNVPYASTSIAKTTLGESDHQLLTTLGTELKYRKYLEEDRRAVLKYKPDLVLGTTSLDSYVKELGIPSVYYTNIVSSRPIYFAEGAETMLNLIDSLIQKRPAYEAMKSFFEG